MSAPTCFCCGRPMADGAYVCQHRTDKAAADLAEIIDLTPAARSVAYGETRRSGGGGGGKPGSRSPGNDDAMDVLDAVGNALSTIARDVAETRGLTIGPDGRSRALSSSVTAEQPSLVPVSTPEPLEAS